MGQRKEITLNTDWLTALIAAGGLVFILLVIAFDLWRIIHGRWAIPSNPMHGAFGRVGDTIFLCWGIFIAVNFCWKSNERLLRFAFGLMLVGMTAHVLRMWVPSSDSVQRSLKIAGILVDLPAFVLLAIYAVKWFRGKVVHV